VSHTLSESVVSLQTHLLKRVLVIRQTPHVNYVQTAINVAAVAENVCMSWRWKAYRVGFITCVQTLARIALLVP
jgi:hypothetical protein